MKKYFTCLCTNLLSFFLFLAHILIVQRSELIQHTEAIPSPYGGLLASIFVMLFLGFSLAVQPRFLRAFQRKPACIIQGCFVLLWIGSAIVLLPVHKNASVFVMQWIVIGYQIGGLYETCKKSNG